MCFILEWVIRLIAMEIVLWLSTFNLMEDKEKLSSFNKDLIYNISLVAWIKALY